jgi:hypothetical protein
MSLKGHVQNGVVVFDEPVELAEGTEVNVTPVTEQELPTLYERFKDIIGVAEDLPADAADQHDRYLYGTLKRP